MLGSDAVVPPEQLGDYAVDGVTPEAAVFPETVEGTSQVLSYAAREGSMVVPWGSGTQMALGNRPRGVDLVLGLSRLNHMLFHEPGDLVASVEAGITLNALQEVLANKEQFLPLEAPSPSRATVGGILAANASGPSRLAYGTARDWLIGVKVVGSDGTISKSGGRVVKNVTGYDLNKLYIGSLGTLGVIAEATFKVAPIPHDRRTLVAAYPSLSAALESAHELLRQNFTPQALHVVSGEVMARLAGLAPMAASEAALLALMAGRSVAVTRKADESARVMERGGTRGVESLSNDEGAALWQAITNLGWTEEISSPTGSCPKGLPCLAAKISILPSQVADFLAMADSLGGPPLRQGIVADVGSGLVRLLWWTQEGFPITLEDTEDLIGRLSRGVGHHAGHVVVERCPLEVKSKIDVWGEPIESMLIMRRIKQELDPEGILNPGRFVGRI